MVSISEARTITDLLERIGQNGELILTELPFNRDQERLIFEFSVNGKHMQEYIPYILSGLPSFAGCALELKNNEVCVYLPAPRYDNLASRLQGNDEILRINLQDHTFQMQGGYIGFYERAVEESRREYCGLDPFWNRFEDFTLKKRLREAFRSLREDMPVFVRIQNFFFILSVRRSYIDEKLSREKEKVARKNAAIKEQNLIEEQRSAFYREHADAQIRKIQEVQQRISQYLCALECTPEYQEYYSDKNW